MSDWFSSSYMARKALAAGKPGRTHHLTEAAQGEYRYVYGAYAAPVLTVSPGDLVVADYGFDELEACFLLTQAGKMRVGNMVDPKYTLGASIRKEYLPKN